MFELTEAKRYPFYRAREIVRLMNDSVERAEMFSSSLPHDALDLEPEPEIRARAQKRLEELYGSALAEIERTPIATTTVLPEEETKDEYEFRLFSRPAYKGFGPGTSRNGLAKVALRSPSPLNKEPGFLVPQRPDSHYLTGETTRESWQEYEAAATSGENLLRGLGTHWVGISTPSSAIRQCLSTYSQGIVSRGE